MEFYIPSHQFGPVYKWLFDHDLLEAVECDADEYERWLNRGEDEPVTWYCNNGELANTVRRLFGHPYDYIDFPIGQ